MATEAELRKIIREELGKAIEKAVHDLAVGKTQKGYDSDKINIKKVLDKK